MGDEHATRVVVSAIAKNFICISETLEMNWWGWPLVPPVNMLYKKEGVSHCLRDMNIPTQ